MRVTAYICSNIDEIERSREESERLGIDPYDYVTPEYQEETTWLHIDDILRARTKKVNGNLKSIVAYMSDGNMIVLKHSSDLEEALDNQFKKQ